MVNVRRRRVVIWIALLAVLLNSFAPAVSHARATNAPAPWLQICTAAGLVAADAERRQGGVPAKPGAATYQHCPYCAPHGASFAAPPAPVALAIESDIGPQWLAAAKSVPTARPVWRAAQTRGPPVL